MHKKRLIIGISGASGIIYAIKLLEILRQLNIETHLVTSKSGQQTRTLESKLTAKELASLADYSYSIQDLAAPIASGSYLTMGMIIAPCSIRTMADIATGTTSNLLTRAADVILKERKRLVLMLRETPLHLGHIKKMQEITEMGGIIAPPVPAFYTNPTSINDIVIHSVGRVLDLFDIEHELIRRWGD